ncbi:hypothetical protein MBANPS3_007943 [Mucor bainieri]
MDRLPIEPLQLIVSYLDLKAKEQLSIVSCRWHDLIVNHCMFTHIAIKDELLQDAIRYFGENERRCQQVRRVRVKDVRNSNAPLYLTLPERFPRLEEFISQHSRNDADAAPMDDIDLQSWNKIVSFDASSADPIMYQTILERGAFVNLTRLSLSFDYANPVDVTTKLVDHLHLAPKLTHLSLHNAAMELRTMEVLHQQAPLLESLHLNSFTKILHLFPKSWEKGLLRGGPNYCKPAPKCFTTLILREMRPSEEWNDNPWDLTRMWLLYIRKKYIHLKHLTIEDEWLLRDEQKEPTYHSALVKLASSLPLLETYNVDIEPVNQQVLKAMDRAGMKLKNMAIYDESMELMEHMGYLGTSRQRETLESLSIAGWRILASPDLSTNFRWLSALRHLEVENRVPFADLPLDLTQFIRNVPQLESFKLISCAVDQTCNSSLRLAYNRTTPTNWKSIHLANMILCKDTQFDADHIDLMTYIAHTCPALDTLILQGDCYRNKFNDGFRMEFPHRYFKRLEISFACMHFFKIYSGDQGCLIQAGPHFSMSCSSRHLKAHQNLINWMPNLREKYFKPPYYCSTSISLFSPFHIMERLPLEVCERIVSCLSTKEKKQLSAVCRRWYDLVINHSMFTHITIKDQKQLQDAMEYFEKNWRQCQQVRSVLVRTQNASKEFYLTLPERFPRLEEYAQEYPPDMTMSDPSATPVENMNLQSWNKITRFSSEHEVFALQLILERGAFVNLTQLELLYSCDARDVTLDLFNHLHLAPKLKHLAISSPSIELSDMELLHQRAPLLETLSLSDFTAIDDFDPEIVQVGFGGSHCEPAPECLTHLTLRNLRPYEGVSDFADELCLLWLNYISKKYIHLKHLTIDDEEVQRQQQEHLYENVLIQLASSLPRLETYNVNIAPIDHKVLRTMDNCHTRLKSLTIFDNSDQITEHMIDLVTSRQATTLQSLSINSSELLNSLDRFTRRPWRFAEIQTLRHLELSNIKLVDSRPLDLAYFIQSAPQLESFKASYYIVPLVCNTSLSAASKTNWKSIELSNVQLFSLNDGDHNYTSLMDYVAHLCPALERLVFEGQHLSEFSTIFKVEFLHRYFKTLDLNVTGFRYFKVYNENRAVWYKYDGISLVETTQEDKRSAVGQKNYVSIMYEGHANLKIMGIDVPNW